MERRCHRRRRRSFVNLFASRQAWFTWTLARQKSKKSSSTSSLRTSNGQHVFSRYIFAESPYIKQILTSSSTSWKPRSCLGTVGLHELARCTNLAKSIIVKIIRNMTSCTRKWSTRMISTWRRRAISKWTLITVWVQIVNVWSCRESWDTPRSWTVRAGKWPISAGSVKSGNTRSSFSKRRAASEMTVSWSPFTPKLSVKQ